MITIKRGTKEDFERLIGLVYEHSYHKMFVLEKGNDSLTLSEIDLDTSRTNPSHVYTDEILAAMVPKLTDASSIPLVAFLEGMPVGYLMATREHWPHGEVIEISGFLVAAMHHRKGIGKRLIEELITIAKRESGCKGIYAEMDTEKYQACKLLLAMGFTFSGAQSYVYSNQNPTPGSKEAIYFYYNIKA